MVRVIVKDGVPSLEYNDATGFGFNQFGMVVVNRESNVVAIDGTSPPGETLAVVNLNNVVAVEIVK